MGSFDKSYYDILNRYQGIIKEGMAVKPIVYKKQGDNYVPANDLDLKVVPPQLLFTKSDDPTTPFVPYDPQATAQTNTDIPTTPTQQYNQISNKPDTTKPSISVTGDGNTPTQGSGPQASVNVLGNRIQYPTSPTKYSPSTQTPATNTSTTQPSQPVLPSTPTSKATTSPVTNVPPSRPGVKSPTNQIGKKPTSAQQSAMRRA